MVSQMWSLTVSKELASGAKHSSWGCRSAVVSRGTPEHQEPLREGVETTPQAFVCPHRTQPCAWNGDTYKASPGCITAPATSQNIKEETVESLQSKLFPFEMNILSENKPKKMLALGKGLWPCCLCRQCLSDLRPQALHERATSHFTVSDLH